MYTVAGARASMEPLLGDICVGKAADLVFLPGDVEDNYKMLKTVKAERVVVAGEVVHERRADDISSSPSTLQGPFIPGKGGGFFCSCFLRGKHCSRFSLPPSLPSPPPPSEFGIELESLTLGDLTVKYSTATSSSIPVAHGREDKTGTMLWPAARKFCLFLERNRPKFSRVVEMGCGNGVVASCASKTVQCSAYVATDVDDDALSMARTNLATNGAPNYFKAEKVRERLNIR